MERDDEIDHLRREVERLTHELLVIGDMAVVDFDDPIVGMVDRVIPNGSKTYADRRKSEVTHYRELVAEVAALKRALRKEVGSKADHCICILDENDEPLAECDLHRGMRLEISALKAKVDQLTAWLREERESNDERAKP